MKFGYMVDSPSYEPHLIEAESISHAISLLEQKFDVPRMARRQPDVPFVEVWEDRGVERKAMSFDDLKQVYHLYPSTDGFFKCQDLCLQLWNKLWEDDSHIRIPGILKEDYAGFSAGTRLEDISQWLDDHTSHGVHSLIIGIPNSIGEEGVLFAKIQSIAQGVRDAMVKHYGDNLSGRCIEASESIVKALSDQLGLTAKTVEGWCRFDDEHYGSDRPWDPHTWVEVPGFHLYIDVTADQFNYGMYPENDYAQVIIREGLPHGMQYDEPTWGDFGMEQSGGAGTQEKEGISPEPASSKIEYGIDDPWLHSDQKVKILNPYFDGQIGTIQSYMWTTGHYIVTMPNGHNLPFRPAELEKVPEKKPALSQMIQSAANRAGESFSDKTPSKEAVPEH